MTNLATHAESRLLCEHCRKPIRDDLGFGYSREPDTTAASAEPVPAGVDLFAFTGRTPRRAAA